MPPHNPYLSLSDLQRLEKFCQYLSNALGTCSIKIENQEYECQGNGFEIDIGGDCILSIDTNPDTCTVYCKLPSDYDGMWLKDLAPKWWGEIYFLERATWEILSSHTGQIIRTGFSPTYGLMMESRGDALAETLYRLTLSTKEIKDRDGNFLEISDWLSIEDVAKMYEAHKGGV